MPTLIYSDTERINGIDALALDLASTLTAFVAAFNAVATVDFRITNQTSFKDAFNSAWSFLRAKVAEGESFEVSGVALSIEKAFELGLLQMPAQTSQLVSISETYNSKVREKFNVLSPFDFNIDNFVYTSGTITFNATTLNEIKETARFYLNEARATEYQLLTDFLACMDQDVPEHPGNDWDRLRKYIERNFKMVLQSGKFKLIPDPKVFSTGFVHGSSDR